MGPVLADNRDYFIADTHFNHGMILKYAGRVEFMTPEDRDAYEQIKDDKGVEYRAWAPSKESRDRMDEAMIDHINAVVPADATLWHLGDFAFTRRAAETRRYRDALKVRDVRLLWGNHDKRKAYPDGLFSAYYEATMIYVFNDRTLTEAEIHADRQLRKKLRRSLSKKNVQPIMLSHYAHVVWPGSHKGWFNLYGHSHGGLVKWMKKHMPNALSMDVGVDVNDFMPLSFAEVFEILNAKRSSRPVHIIDHHGHSLRKSGELEGDLT